MATHSNVLAWRTPGTVEPGELPSMGSLRVGNDWSDLAVAVAKDWKVKVKSLCCVWLCNPMDCSLPGSSVHRIFQARVLNGLPFPSPGIEPGSPALQTDDLPSEPPGQPYHLKVDLEKKPDIWHIENEGN